MPQGASKSLSRTPELAVQPRNDVQPLQLGQDVVEITAHHLQPFKRVVRHVFFADRVRKTDSLQVPPFPAADVLEYPRDAPAFTGVGLSEFLGAESLDGAQQVLPAPGEKLETAL